MSDIQISGYRDVGYPDFRISGFWISQILVPSHSDMAKLEKSPKLKLITVARGGVVNVNLESATRHNLIVTNAPGRNARAVAEFTIALMIDLTKGITNGHTNLTSKKIWKTDLYDYKKVTKNLNKTLLKTIPKNLEAKVSIDLIDDIFSYVSGTRFDT